MDSKTWISIASVSILALAIGFNGFLFNLLENFIYCWFYFQDNFGTEYKEFLNVCVNATDLAINGLFDPYVFKWSTLCSIHLIKGACSGLIFPFCDLYGRRKSMLISCICGMFGSTFTILGFQSGFYLSSELPFYFMLTGRLFIGFTSGFGWMVLHIYVMEIVPLKLKSSVGMLHSRP